MVQIITNSNGGGGGVGVYKYKGSVQTYEDLPTSGMKIGDTYNVINEHTTNPKFPAGTNVAWTGTEWDALGGNIDLSGYQKKLVEGNGIDINQTTNEISVEDAVIGGAAKGATAIQPNDNVSELVNDAGYLVSSDLKQSNWGQTDSSAIDYIKNKPTIGNATLTIQKNGTTVNTITMNATSNVTANISVPTKVSDLSNDSGFITKDVNDLTNYTKTSSLGAVALSNNYPDLSNKPDLSVYQTTANLVTNLTDPDDTHYPSAKAVSDAITASGGGDMLKSVYDPNNKSANAFDYNNFINTPTIPGVIDSLNSSSTTDALSANQGKVLKDAIDNLSGLGKFLSLWNSATGQPISFPLATPYTYTTGDWFMVETVGTTNYKPNGSSYTGTASTTVETETVEQGDVYIYDGTNWLLQKNTAVEVSFSAIAGQPTDNTALAAALNAKQNTLTTQTAYTSKGSATKVPQITTNTLGQVTGITEVTITQPTKTSDLTNDSGFITSSAIPTDYVKTSGNQTIAGTKTFSTSPVVPSKTTAATNTGTAIATEAQVYKKQDTISDLATIRSGASAGATALQPNANISSLTNDSGYLTSSTGVTTVNGSHGAVTVNGFNPGGTATTGYVVTKTASGYEWQAPSGGVGISSQANNILTSGAKLRAGTQDNYEALGTYDNNTIYLTI